MERPHTLDPVMLRALRTAALTLVFVGGCASSSSPPGTRPDAGAADAALPDAGAPDTGTFVPRCGDLLCTEGAEDCETCPLDCDVCPVCDMAPTCTGALAVPTSSEALPECSNTDGSGDRTNYACGVGLGVPPSDTTCADPQLRIRVREISIRRGFFDISRNLYCVISAEDGRHSELLLTSPREVAGNRRTTTFNLPPSQSALWGQGDLYRSISNITVTYTCFLTSNTAAAQRVLDDISDRAAEVAEHADGYGWVFGTASVLGTIIGSSLGAGSDDQILDVQQTIDAGALLTMTNARSWEIRGKVGNLDLSGASELRLTIESWGCADVRTRFE